MYKHIVPYHLWHDFMRACNKRGIKVKFYREGYNVLVTNKIYKFNEIILSLRKENKND